MLRVWIIIVPSLRVMIVLVCVVLLVRRRIMILLLALGLASLPSLAILLLSVRVVISILLLILLIGLVIRGLMVMLPSGVCGLQKVGLVVRSSSLVRRSIGLMLLVM